MNRNGRSETLEIKLLHKKIAQMGGLAEQLVALSFDALLKRDPGLAEHVVERDKKIDIFQAELDELVVKLIADQRPAADDLKLIMAAIRIAGDLERIGDLAKNVAKRAHTIAGQNYPRGLTAGVRHMFELAMQQLKDVLDALAEGNPELAHAVWMNDEQLDATYNSTFRGLLMYMMEDPRSVGLCTHLLFVAKNVERIGDHTTNIAETVHFVIRGEAITAERPKRDITSSTLF